VTGPHGKKALPPIVKFLSHECAKKGTAHANAFVLNDWCSVLLLQFAKSPDAWASFGLDVALANARAIETCVSTGSDRRAGRLAHSALVSTRRALRAIFRSEAIGPDALAKLVTTLTAKASAPTAGNAVFLGVIAGVSSRLPTIKPLLEARKQDYYAFYTREIIGSRSQLPHHISNALHDFFDTFPTFEELRKDVFQPMEKALLRAPEVVLNDIVSPMILALPESMDLSDILLGNMLKPLLANVKSTNPVIRAGALRTFKALASRSKDTDKIDKVADEVLNPLKQGKVSGADQKVLHAQMLAALPESPSLSKKIPAGIAAVALKEPNEPAVLAEVSAMTTHLNFGLANGVALEKTVSDAFIKGMGDKRVPVKRLWAIRAADIWWNLSEEQQSQPDVLAFCQATLPKLVELWQDVNANPLPAAQSGLATVGHYVTALLIDRVQNMKDEKLASIFKKSDVVSHSLATQPKPSFILNPKVYSKLSTEEDVSVALRALNAIAPSVAQATSKDAPDAWSQAYIFLIVAQSISAQAKSAAKQALTQAYLQASPEKISKIIIDGIWSWYKSNELEDKESAALASKTGSSELGAVLACICLPPDTLRKHGVSIEASDLHKQAMRLVVVARKEVLPRVSWIELCLRMGVDPGEVVRNNLEDFMRTVNESTEVCSTFYSPNKLSINKL
jgi:hypothetical protein